MNIIYSFFILLLLASNSFGALTLRDDFDRPNSQMLSDFGVPAVWFEKQNYGEGAINSNMLKWTIQSLTSSTYQVIPWMRDICEFSSCTVQIDLGVTSTSGIGTGVASGNGIALIRHISDFVVNGSGFNTTILTIRRNMAGALVVYFVTNNETVTYTGAPVRPKDDTTSETAKVTFSKSGSDYIMNVCWGTNANPCFYYNVNLTISSAPYSVTETVGYFALWNNDNTNLANVWLYDNFYMDAGEVLVEKPWVTGLTTTGATIHAKVTSNNAYSMTIQYGTSPTLSSYSETGAFWASAENWMIGKEPLVGLNANTKYYYRVKVGTVVDSNIYSFTTLPTNGVASNFSFGAIGCYSNFTSDPTTHAFAPILQNLNPLFTLAVGDNGYFGDAQDFWWDYFGVSRIRVGINLQTLMANVPFFGTYNDHDSGIDDTVGVLDYVHYGAGTVDVTNGSAVVTGTIGDLPVWNTTNIPRTGNASTNMTFTVDGDRLYKITSIDSDTQLTLDRPYHESSGTGASYFIDKSIYSVERYLPYYFSNPSSPVGYDSNAQYYSFQVGRVKFWVLDGTKYSSDFDNTDTISKTMFGTNQYNWLVDTFKTDAAPLKILVTPEPIWTDREAQGKVAFGKRYYENERNKILKLLNETTGKVIIVGSDSHVNAWGEVNGMKHVIEFNTSRVNLPPGTGMVPEKANVWRTPAVTATTDYNGFGFISITDNGTDILATLTIYNVDGTKYTEVNFGTKNQRNTLCAYDVDYCPSGRSKISRSNVSRSYITRSAVP